MDRLNQVELVAGHGSGPAVEDVCLVEYYLLQPAPSQWVAVGRPPGPNGVRSILVGAGATEDAAVMALRDRCPHDALADCVMVRRDAEEQYA